MAYNLLTFTLTTYQDWLNWGKYTDTIEDNDVKTGDSDDEHKAQAGRWGSEFRCGD